MSDLPWKSFNSTIEELKAAKLGLAAFMFAYVCIACFLPILISYLLSKYSTTLDEATNYDNSNKPDTSSGLNPSQKLAKNRFHCINWSQEVRRKLGSRANCLAAGAFLSVGFLDVLLDTIESVEDALNVLHIQTKLPIACLLTLAGFFLVFGVEQLGLTLYERQSYKYHQRLQGHSQTRDENDISVLVRRISPCHVSNRDLTTNLTGMPDHLTMHLTPEDYMVSTSEQNLRPTDEELVHDHNKYLTILKADIDLIQAMILLCALSLHSVFEGLALGLCDSVKSLLTLFGALSLHKILIAISIGINLATQISMPYFTEQRRLWQHVKSKTLILQLLAVFLFAGASPIGVLLGWAITLQHDNTGFLVAEAILQGLACGTFFYVVFCELIPKEFKETKTDKIGKFMSLLIGFVIIALVICLLPGD